jgi:hypothetical protein
MSNSKVVDSLFLNVLGFQPLRYFLGELLRCYRLKRGKYIVNDEYKKNGFLLINNFLEEKEFYLLQNEFENIMQENFIMDSFNNPKNKDSKIRVFYYNFKPNDELQFKYPKLCKLYNNNIIRKHFHANEQKNKCEITMQIERVVGVAGSKLDIQQSWHVDTFHQTHKGWLYLSKVDSDAAPFYFVVGSQLFSFKRALWEWYQSILYSLKKGDPSFRVNQDDLIFFENNVKEITSNENTLLFANACGFHKRGDIKPNRNRDSIHFDSRENVFHF